VVAAVLSLLLLAVDLAVVAARAGDHQRAPEVTTSRFEAPPTLPPTTTGAGGSAAESGLGRLLVSPPAGFVEITGGVNGELSADQVAEVTNRGIDLFDVPSEHVNPGDAAGVHAFGHTWANGTQGRVLVVIVLEATSAGARAGGINAIKSSTEKVPGLTTFATPSIPDSFGVVLERPITNLGTLHLVGVLFEKGSRLAVVELGGLRDTPAAADVVPIARAQYDKL